MNYLNLESLNFFINYIFKYSILPLNINIQYLENIFIIIYKYINYYQIILHNNRLKTLITNINKSIFIPFQISSLQHKILLITQSSKVLKSGVKKQFKTISIIGNTNGWLGIGLSKKTLLTDSIDNSFLQAFTKIYYYPLRKYPSLITKYYYPTKKYYKISINMWNINKGNKNILNILNLIGYKAVTLKLIKKITLYKYIRNLIL